jgi:hypothetical protein
MQEKTAEIEALMNGPGLRRSELAAFVADSQKAAALVMRGLTSAADLVNSFKQVAVDRTTEQRRFFNLQQVCHEIIATMMNRIRAANHSIELDVPDTIGMDSYPGPFGQVITNFINNALLHAFAPGTSGNMVLSRQHAGDGRVLIDFSRRRRRHSARAPGPHLRSLLHHQAGPGRQRPGAVDQLQHRHLAAGRPDRGRQQRARGHLLHPRPAAHRAPARYGDSNNPACSEPGPLAGVICLYAKRCSPRTSLQTPYNYLDIRNRLSHVPKNPSSISCSSPTSRSTNSTT